MSAAPVYAWDPQLGEPAQGYERFRWYLAALERSERRSYRNTAAEFGVSFNAIQEMATRWRWQDRALAFDAWLSHQANESLSDRAKRAAEDQLRVAERLLRVAERAVAEAEANQGGAPGDESDEDQHQPQDVLERADRAASVLERVQRVMRTALGQPQTTSVRVVRHEGAPSLQSASEEQQLALRFALALCGQPGACPDVMRASARDALVKLAIADLNANPPEAPKQ